MKKIKFFNSKKALTGFQVLTGAIILVMLMVIIIMFMYKVHNANQQQAYDARCQSSLMAYSRLISMPQIPFHEGAAAKETDIDCPVKYVTLPKTKKTNKQRKMIADLMFECWHNYGEGKVRLFSANSKKFCAVCSIIQFQDKKDALAGMPYYLMTQKAPVKKDNRYPTYYEYVTGNKPREDDLKTLQEQDITFLRGDQKYTIFFTYYEKKTWGMLKRVLVGAAIGAVAIGAIAGVVVIGTAVASAATATAAGSAAAGAAGSAAAASAAAGGATAAGATAAGSAAAAGVGTVATTTAAGTLTTTTVAAGAGYTTTLTAGSKIALAGTAIAKTGTAAALGGFIMGVVGGLTTSGPQTPETNLVFMPYTTESIKKLGCKSIPVSTVEKKFR